LGAAAGRGWRPGCADPVHRRSRRASAGLPGGRVLARHRTQVVLHLDPAPLALPPGVFDHIPDLDQVIGAMLPRLQVPVPSTCGRDLHARDLLAQAQALRQQVDLSWHPAPLVLTCSSVGGWR